MRRLALTLSLGFLALSLLPAQAAAAPAYQDDPACKDHPALTRMANYYLRDKRFDCVETAFDAERFRASKKEEVSVEGRKIVLVYHFDKKSGPTPSPLQIQRNYANAVRAAGGEVLFEDDGHYRELYAKLAKGSREIWVKTRVVNSGDRIHLTLIEKEAMAQDVVAKAETLAADLKATGKVAIYGVYFDTGKAGLKPESDPALAEMAKLLKGDPALKVHIVGHTDSTGGFEDNLRLSRARAESVVQALVGRHGIDAKRLAAHGVSSLSPVASNRAEEGLAKNRRVELVEQ